MLISSLYKKLQKIHAKKLLTKMRKKNEVFYFYFDVQTFEA
jgi:hypothetical protein